MPRKIKVKKEPEPQSKENKELADQSEKIIKHLQSQFPGKLNFSLHEAATALNLSYHFVRKHTVNGKIKAIKYGDRYMINIYELSRVLTEGI